MVCHVSTIKHWPDWHSSTRLSFCFAMLNVAIVQPINACQIKQVLRLKALQDARELGNAFSADIPDFDLYSSNTVRTIQSATWFSAGKKLTVDKRLLQCGNEIYSAIKDLQSKAPDKNIVIFTHNHCLTYIAKNKRDATFKPDYLDGLVMHVEKGKVYLDGEFVNH